MSARRYFFAVCTMLLVATACSGNEGESTSSTRRSAVTADSSTAPATTLGSMVSATTTTPATTTTTLPSLPDLTGELAWFAPLPPLPMVGDRMFIGSDDFMDLFDPEADWAVASSHIQVFKLYGEWVAYQATEAELATAVRAIRERGMALAVEAGPLDAPPECGQGVEGFAGSAEGNLIADRIKRAGGTIDVIALDEPYYFASIYDGENACHWSAEKVAAEVGEYVDLMSGHFPEIIVGDTEPTPHPVEAVTYTDWLETFREVNGYDLAFLHLDIDWARIRWPVMVGEIVEFGVGFGVPIGMIYIGNRADPTDEVAISIMGARALRLEDEHGVTPNHVLFQSWIDHPDRVLPESDPHTFTGFIRTYFEDRGSLGFRIEGAGANVAYSKDARASRAVADSEPVNAFDGDTGTVWSAGAFATQWIEVDLGGAFDVAEIRMIPSQTPAGPTRHVILGRGPGTGGTLIELAVIEEVSADGEPLVATPGTPWLGLDTIRVRTTSSPSWVAWREIEVLAAG